MKYNEYAEAVLNEIGNCIKTVDSAEIELFVERIINAPRVFCDGVGRSGLQASAFTMRLTHMGITSYFVPEITTPSIQHGDLLIICSGSGETENLIAHAKKAKSFEAEITLISASEKTSLHCLSDQNILVHADTKLHNTHASIQPMGTLFEQSLSILLDVVVLLLMERLDVSNSDMYRRHKNLE